MYSSVFVAYIDSKTNRLILTKILEISGKRQEYSLNYIQK